MSPSELDPLLQNPSPSTYRDEFRPPHRYRPTGSVHTSHGSAQYNDYDEINGDESDSQDSESLKPHDFYELIGMKIPDAQGNTPGSLEAAHGFYGQMCQEKRAVGKKYHLYDILVMFLLIVQTLLSAVFIVLGALNADQHVAIAVLGAVGSVIAGVLALMRGQGLPTRLRTERDSLKRVILEADELYWDVGAGREVTYGDVKRIRDAYISVLEDARKNHPDMCKSTVVSLKEGLTRTATPTKRDPATIRYC